MEPVRPATADPLDRIASALLEALDRTHPIPPLTESGELTLADAYRIAARIRAMREARGERVVGRKIGFTNRNIWPEYGVYAPIWGYVYAGTLGEAAAGVDLAPLAEPRIEPEIAFGLGQAPEPGMDERALLGCVAWVAHGFEIVQSVFPDWRFAAADTVAAFGLHGALRLGEKATLAGPERESWLATLPAFTIALARDGAEQDRGIGKNVLDGPLSALRHLVTLLSEDDANPPLQAGEIVTTGTLTRAFPVKPGETWSTTLDGIALPGLALALR